jgi:hypothetical protein
MMRATDGESDAVRDDSPRSVNMVQVLHAVLIVNIARALSRSQVGPQDVRHYLNEIKAVMITFNDRTERGLVRQAHPEFRN